MTQVLCEQHLIVPTKPFSVISSPPSLPATTDWPGRVRPIPRLACSLGHCDRVQEDALSQPDPLPGAQNPVHRKDYCQMALGFGAKRPFSVRVWAATGQIQVLRKLASSSGEENEVEEGGKQRQRAGNKRDPETETQTSRLQV